MRAVNISRSSSVCSTIFIYVTSLQLLPGHIFPTANTLSLKKKGWVGSCSIAKRNQDYTPTPTPNHQTRNEVHTEPRGLRGEMETFVQKFQGHLIKEVVVLQDKFWIFCYVFFSFLPPLKSLS